MSVDFFEAVSLPDSAKEDLCRGLIEEFGGRVTSTRHKDGELIHGCLIPWANHRDQQKNPTASLNYKKLAFKCLGCQSSGGLLWYIAVMRGVSGPEAREWLSEQTGLGGADFDLSALLRIFDALYDGSRHERPPMPNYSEKMLDPWLGVIHPLLTDGVPEVGLKGRGIPEETLREMKVGYAPDYFMGIGLPTSERFVIPHFWKGKLVGMQTRRVFDDGTSKYKSTPEFPKDVTIYDYDPKRRKVLVVESPITVLRHRHHLPVEGTFGADVTDAQVRLLSMHEQVVLMMDPDVAGWKATLGWDGLDGEHHPGLIERLSPYCDVRVVNNPWSVDGADMDDETIAALYEQAVPWPLWEKPTILLCIQCGASHEGACP